MAGIRLQASLRFPARVEARDGDGADKTNGVLTIRPDYGELAAVGEDADASGLHVRAWDQANDSYVRLPLTGLAGITGDGVTHIVALTQAEYDALDPPVSTTLYVIVE